MELYIAVPPDVNKVLRRLKRFGYQSYLVGGCVRDTLIGKVPKDWDIATDAVPAEIQRVFDNSRIVGRRFPIVHVCFQSQIIEVVTFRDGADGYGTLADDVYRRDYTVNALYWDDGEVIDPFTGLDDIESRTVVCIGKPDVRFAEDPVRMLRAVRLKALGFTLPLTLIAEIERNQGMLKFVNKSRLYCEFVKAMSSTTAEQVRELMALGLMQQFFPSAYCGEYVVLPDDLNVCSVICAIVWKYYCDLVGSVQCEFNLHPIPASQKAAKHLVEQLRKHMDLDRSMALAVKERLHARYRAEQCT